MKKIINVILIICLLFTFAACKNNDYEVLPTDSVEPSVTVSSSPIPKKSPSYPDVEFKIDDETKVLIYSLFPDASGCSLKQKDFTVNLKKYTSSKILDVGNETIVRMIFYDFDEEKTIIESKGGEVVGFFWYYPDTYTVYKMNDIEYVCMYSNQNKEDITFKEFCDKAYRYQISTDPKPTGGFGLAA